MHGSCYVLAYAGCTPNSDCLIYAPVMAQLLRQCHRPLALYFCNSLANSMSPAVLVAKVHSLDVQAIDKRHSTVQEALQIASSCKAYRTVLTHFSQRYPRMPAGLPNEGEMAIRVAAAFDGMCVSLPDLPRLAAMNPALEAMFQRHDHGPEGAVEQELLDEG